MNNQSWKQIIKNSIVDAEQLAACLPVHRDDIERVIQTYPLRINSYYLSLIRKPDDPIWKQAVPDIREIEASTASCPLSSDPLSEQDQSPVPNLIHRYPDRVVFLVSGMCAVYCRFCMRKRSVGGRDAFITEKMFKEGISYIQSHPSIKDVILSGGDPLLLNDRNIYRMLSAIRAIGHVEIIRIHTRTPCTLPQRITLPLARILKSFHPLYINTHFNHPDEITQESSRACILLADSGIPVGCQTVLLKGINDSGDVMERLLRNLIRIRVKPYYIHLTDPVKGTGHFRTSIETGLQIMESLRGHMSGIAVPQFMIDLPGGGGKIPLSPEYVVHKDPKRWLIRNYQGKVFDYVL